MAQIQQLTAKIEEARYEYVILTCPHEDCGQRITLGRIDDLRGSLSEYFSQCPICSRCFRITGDHINSLPQQILIEAQELIGEKRLILAIMAICQAYEVYFAWCLRKRLVYDDFVAGTALQQRDLDRMNCLLDALQSAIRKWPFEKLRNAFVASYALVGSQERIAFRGKLFRGVTPSKAAIDDARPERIKQFQRLGIHELRNRCVHHRAYRPSSAEVITELDKARELILGDLDLFLHHDAEVLLNRAHG